MYYCQQVDWSVAEHLGLFFWVWLWFHGALRRVQFAYDSCLGCLIVCSFGSLPTSQETAPDKRATADKVGKRDQKLVILWVVSHTVRARPLEGCVACVVECAEYKAVAPSINWESMRQVSVQYRGKGRVLCSLHPRKKCHQPCELRFEIVDRISQTDVALSGYLYRVEMRSI